jgi:hypothetical protein
MPMRTEVGARPASATTAPDSAGTVLAPVMTATPLARARAVELRDAGNERVRVGKVDIVDARRDAGFGHAVVGALERPDGVDNDIRPPRHQGGEILRDVDRGVFDF